MSENECNKKVWTEKERLDLATKLDEDLDAWINGLEKKEYTEGWREDNWEEEMEKHPFFMTKAPKPEDAVDPLLEGLQKLKYDPEENTKEELALSYKDDGNFNMKYKNYRLAISSFTEGIKVQCDDVELQSALYNNRSAAHFFLQNYRSALIDARQALKYKANYPKAQWRAAQCAFHLNAFDLCETLCKQMLKDENPPEKVYDLMRKNWKKKVEVQSAQNFAERKLKEERRKSHELCAELTRRNIKFYEMQGPTDATKLTEAVLRPIYPQLETHPVRLYTKWKTILWPAIFFYPALKSVEFMREVSELTPLMDVIGGMLREPLSGDSEHKYQTHTVSVYYQDRTKSEAHKVDIAKTIKEITMEENFYIYHGTLAFFVVLRGSGEEEDMIKSIGTMSHVGVCNV